MTLLILDFGGRSPEKSMVSRSCIEREAQVRVMKAIWETYKYA